MKYLISLFYILISQSHFITQVFAEDAGVFENSDISGTDLREGNISIETIPGMIASVIQFVIWIAGTMAIVALIYNAVQMQLKSGITWDSSWVESAKKWMYWAIFWFILAIMSWFIVKRVVEILSTF